MPPMELQGFIEWLTQILQRMEILLPTLAGAAIIAFLGIRYRNRRRNVAVEEARVIGEEAEEPAEKAPEFEDEFSEARIRTLEALKTRGTLKPIPLAASKEGGHYPDIVGISLSKAEDLIQDLVKRGLAFEGEVEFSVVSCPLCGSCSQVALISCKNCGSFRVHEVKYYRHTCGYVGPESNFLTEEKLRCPQCKSSEGIELYHKRYYCEDCKTESDEVNIAFKCGSCGSFYDESNMVLKQFKKIELSREGLEEYEKINRVLSVQIQRLRTQGYAVERPATLVGESGVTHNFEAVARRGDEVVAIASSFGEPLTQVLFKLGVAKTDLRLSRLIVVTGKPSSPAEREFARSLGIEVVEPPQF